MSLAESSGKSVADIIVEYEAEHSLKSDISVKKHMSEIWQVMKESADKGVANTQKSVSGMVGGDAKKLFMYESGYCGDFVRDAAAGKDRKADEPRAEPGLFGIRIHGERHERGLHQDVTQAQTRCRHK